MSLLPLKPIVAGSREAGARCVHCQAEVVFGVEVVVCRKCGAVQHAACYQAHGNCCGSYECAPTHRTIKPHEAPALRILPTDLEAAVPLPPQRPILAQAVPITPPSVPRTSRSAVASLIVALAGIPLFGALTGLVAIVLGSLALGTISRTRQRGAGLALAGILLGLADVVGWIIFISVMLSRPQVAIDATDFEIDPDTLKHLAPPIQRPMRANVLVQTEHGRGLFASGGIGSGVILQIRGGQALIVTNRHVIDSQFDGGGGKTSAKLPEGANLRIKLLGQPMQPGRVVWVAPDGIDLALLRIPVLSEEPQAARWKRKQPLMAGEEVFTIGNPQHLDWSQTRGTISQFRRLTRGTHKVRLIQTDAALNPGNSGGGLYDKNGNLIGINTLASDKRLAEGINFAIALETFFSLNPPVDEGAGTRETIEKKTE